MPDEKFIDAACELFEEALPFENEFLIINKNNYLKYIKNTKVKIVHPFKLLKKDFIKSLEKYDFVVLHWLDDFKKYIILNSSDKVKFLWIGWGGDYYKYINKNLFLEKTKKMKEESIKKNDFSLQDFTKNLVKYFLFEKKVKRYEKDILKRINFFAPVLEEEYFLIKKNISFFNAKFIDWNYGSLDNMIDYNNLGIKGNNILLGNSATFENNHIEILQKLNELNISTKIIMPLSYGDNQYKQFIYKYCNRLNLNIEYLDKFIPIEEYNKIISSCSIVIMNHLRQQALGNIIISMYHGAKIFLNKQNPIFNYFMRLGANIYTIDKLNKESINSCLSEKEILENRQILEKEWSKEVMINKTKRLIEIIKGVEY